MAQRCFIVGVAGGTGSGKTTIARTLSNALTPAACVLIEYDAYYHDRSELTMEERTAVNYDHPDALETELLANHLRELRAGRPVDVPIYDFVTHTRSPETRRLEPSRVVIVEGILTLAHEAIRDQLDIKLFVDTDPDLRVFRRIRRDLEHRGRNFASIRDRYYRHVRPMHHEFVEPSKRHADLIIPEGGENRVAIDVILARLNQAVQGG